MTCRRAGILSFLLLAAGCGRHQAIATPAATINGRPISWPELQANVTYAARFFRLGEPAQGGTCMVKVPKSPVCERLLQQVLARLIEERVIAGFAAHHHMTLSSGDREGAAGQAALLLDQGSGIPATRAGRAMLTGVILREMVVQQVEKAITATAPGAGISYHIQRFLVPAFRSRSQAYRSAIQFAVGGSAPPAGTRSRVEWVAAFRLGRALRASLRLASPGDFVGPFVKPGGYQVVRLLGTGFHRYGAPARRDLTSRLFHAWLAGEIQKASIECFTERGKQTVCPKS
ncbi:MAG: SurA N-terminal domain-containing protein [Chloroflexota bacterium]|nr:SurA N-terminal domain-containing protein [Chloroflexota bacterium]